MTLNLWSYVIGFCLFNLCLGANNELDAVCQIYYKYFQYFINIYFNILYVKNIF